MPMIRNRGGAAALLLLCAALPAAMPAMAQEKSARPAVFPGGASAVIETHEDWTVSCGVAEGRKHCLLRQTLGAPETRAPVLAIEVEPEDAAKARAVITMPFGLNLADGVKLSFGEEEETQALSFESCSERGCLVPLALEGPGLEKLKGGSDITFASVATDSGETLAFRASLKGFASAYARALVLSER